MVDSLVNTKDKSIVVKGEIDLSKPESIINYGISAQNKLIEFSDQALQTIGNQNYGSDIDDITKSLVETIDISENEPKTLWTKLFPKKLEFQTNPTMYYSNVSGKIDLIISKFDQYQFKLIRDINILQTLYDKNQEYYDNLTEYIEVGKEEIERIEKEELPKLDPASMEYTTLASGLERFKSRILDLELSKNVSFQLAPQIKLLQSSNEKLINKIQSTITSTIPLWKTHMVIALSIENNLEVNELLNNVDKSTINLSENNFEYIENIKKSGKDPVMAVNKEFVDSIKDLKDIIN